MAETLTNTNGAIVLKQSTAFNRVFFFGTTSQTVVVNLSKNGGAFAPAAGAVSEVGGAGNGNGWYAVSLTNVDTSNAGSGNAGAILAYHCTAGAGGPVDFSDIVQTTILTDFLIDGTGRVFVVSNNKQNAPQNVFFPMTVNGVPTPGLTITGQRNFGSGFSSIGGTITDLGNGSYMAALTAADTNAATGLFRFTASGADERDIFLYTSP